MINNFPMKKMKKKSFFRNSVFQKSFFYSYYFFDSRNCYEKLSKMIRNDNKFSDQKKFQEKFEI